MIVLDSGHIEIHRVIRVNHDSLPVGTISYGEQDGRQWINIHIDVRYRRRGYGRRAVEVLLEQFRQWKIPVATMRVPLDDDLAWMFAKACGFQTYDVVSDIQLMEIHL